MVRTSSTATTAIVSSSSSSYRWHACPQHKSDEGRTAAAAASRTAAPTAVAAKKEGRPATLYNGQRGDVVPQQPPPSPPPQYYQQGRVEEEARQDADEVGTTTTTERIPPPPPPSAGSSSSSSSTSRNSSVGYRRQLQLLREAQTVLAQHHASRPKKKTEEDYSGESRNNKEEPQQNTTPTTRFTYYGNIALKRIHRKPILEEEERSSDGTNTTTTRRNRTEQSEREDKETASDVRTAISESGVVTPRWSFPGRINTEKYYPKRRSTSTNKNTTKLEEEDPSTPVSQRRNSLPVRGKHAVVPHRRGSSLKHHYSPQHDTTTTPRSPSWATAKTATTTLPFRGAPHYNSSASPCLKEEEEVARMNSGAVFSANISKANSSKNTDRISYYEEQPKTTVTTTIPPRRYFDIPSIAKRGRTLSGHDAVSVHDHVQTGSKAAPFSVHTTNNKPNHEHPSRTGTATSEIEQIRHSLRSTGQDLEGGMRKSLNTSRSVVYPPVSRMIGAKIINNNNDNNNSIIQQTVVYSEESDARKTNSPAKEELEMIRSLAVARAMYLRHAERASSFTDDSSSSVNSNLVSPRSPQGKVYDAVKKISKNQVKTVVCLEPKTVFTPISRFVKNEKDDEKSSSMLEKQRTIPGTSDLLLSRSVHVHSAYSERDKVENNSPSDKSRSGIFINPEEECRNDTSCLSSNGFAVDDISKLKHCDDFYPASSILSECMTDDSEEDRNIDGDNRFLQITFSSGGISEKLEPNIDFSPTAESSHHSSDIGTMSSFPEETTSFEQRHDTKSKSRTALKKLFFGHGRKMAEF